MISIQFERRWRTVIESKTTLLMVLLLHVAPQIQMSMHSPPQICDFSSQV
jgi:hypothetical protein